MEVELETNLRQLRNESLFHNIVYAKVEVQCLKNVCVASISFAPAIYNYYDAKSGVDKERTTPSTFRERLTVMSVISFFSLTLIFRPLELEVKMHIFH